MHESCHVDLAGLGLRPGQQRVVKLERRSHTSSQSGLALLIVAEGEGFEPSRRCYRLRDFQSRALGQAMRPFQTGYQLSAIGHRLSVSSRPYRLTDSILAERVGFEPTEAHHLTAFRERHLQPLGHLSNPVSISSCLSHSPYVGRVPPICRRQAGGSHTASWQGPSLACLTWPLLPLQPSQAR
jgi:hypothetical protein